MDDILERQMLTTNGKSQDIFRTDAIDRLARSTRDLLNVLATVSERGAGFRSIADPMLEPSRQAHHFGVGSASRV
jgi:DNA invertase Pin-like site-specific DNA recombinase